MEKTAEKGGKEVLGKSSKSYEVRLKGTDSKLKSIVGCIGKEEMWNTLLREEWERGPPIKKMLFYGTIQNSSQKCPIKRCLNSYKFETMIKRWRIQTPEVPRTAKLKNKVFFSTKRWFFTDFNCIVIVVCS